jgi:HAD superfamily hydrolase (TIGR01484 family)
MGWRPQLVALDVDGTIMGADGIIPDPVRAAVTALIDSGILVMLATGRTWSGTESIFTDLALPRGPAVCSNGAVTVRYPPMEVLKTVTFDASEVVKAFLEHAPNTLVAVEELGRGHRVSGAFPPGELQGESMIADIDDLIADPVTRVVLRDPSSTDTDFIKLAEQLGMQGCSYFVGYTAWLDVVPEGVDKATGLTEAAGRYGIGADQVLALGDGRNDVEMLEWAGRGVAMGDAPDEVKLAADHVTGLFGDGGTVAELTRWL